MYQTKRRKSNILNAFQPSKIPGLARQVMIPLMDRGPASTEQQITSIEKRLSKPTPHKLSLLKDSSYIIKLQKQTRLLAFCKQLDNRYSILSPDGYSFLIWNIMLIIAILFNFFELPVSIFLTQQVYTDQFSHPQWVTINIIFLFIILVDMIFIRPNLAFYQDGQLVVNRYQIMRKYFKLQVYFDIISFIVLLAYISVGIRNLVYLKIFFYLKFYSLLKVDKALINYLELHKTLYPIYLFLRIFIVLAFVVIWSASIYFAIDYAYYLEQGTYFNNNQLWLNDTFAGVDFIQDIAWPYWLAYAIYWASEVAATIGYGVGTPRNPVTVFYCSLIIILMTIVFALFINTVWGVIGELEQSGVDYYQNWASLNKILQQKKISKQLNVRVSEYFHQTWKYNDKTQSNQINQNLSQNLKTQLRILSHLHIFHNIPLFQRWQQDHHDQWVKFKIQIFDIIEIQQLAQNQILTLNKKCDQTFYCVLKGRIKLQIKGDYLKQEYLFKITQRFGYQQFFMQKPLTYVARADCFTRLYKLQRTKFIDCLKKFPILYFDYVRVINELRMIEDRTILYQQCWFCKGLHTPFKCPNKTRWRQTLILKDALSVKYMNMVSGMDRTESESKKIYRNLIRSSKVINMNLCSSINVDVIQLSENNEQIQKQFDYKDKMKYNF